MVNITDFSLSENSLSQDQDIKFLLNFTIVKICNTNLILREVRLDLLNSNLFEG